MGSSEFDDYAATYESLHRQNIRISGEEPAYFAAYKIDELGAALSRRGAPPPRRILDFGCGIGTSIPHLRRRFPEAEITGVDVSSKSLDIARERFGSLAEFVHLDGGALPFAEGHFDLAFSACVFHHIDHADHARTLAAIRRTLSPQGNLLIFEHNPLNPLTVYATCTCPFDADAHLVRAGQLRRRMQAAGFRDLERRYCLFFPGFLRRLRPFEPKLAWLPLGAQYYVIGRGA